MWTLRRRSNYAFVSLFLQTQLKPSNFRPAQILNAVETYEVPSRVEFLTSLSGIGLASQFSSFTSTSEIPGVSNVIQQENGDQSDIDNEDDDDIENRGLAVKDENIIKDVEKVMGILRNFGSNGVEAKQKLEQCGIASSSELVVEVLSRVRNDWEAAYTFFLWAGKHHAHSLREYHSMVSILGKMRKFDTAWNLIDEMRRGTTGSSMVTPQTLLIMIRKYCAIHDVAKAINTFYAFKRFKFSVGIEEFQDLLSALCRYKNVQDAEHLMFCNEKVFPFDTKSFNIVLNGWCNMVVNLREAKRFWREMSRRNITQDAVSYSSMISCYSKASNINDVLKLFNQMKEVGVNPDKKVYNAVIYALAKGKLVKEARNLLKTMEEKGFKPDVVTYNSLIKPLCKARRIDEAKLVFDEMLQRGLSPSIRTYHAFFGILKTGEDVFELLIKMKTMGCPPTYDTYIMLIRKFCRWRQIENVFKLWNEMGDNGLSPDRSSYIVLVHGLFLNGKLEEASKYYQEMKGKGFEPEPKTDEMLQAWISGKQMAGSPKLDSNSNQDDDRHLLKNTNSSSKASVHEKDFRKLPETRKVTRERGFSFWEH